MPGRTLDAIIQETLGLKEMVIARLQWQIEDLKAQLADVEPKAKTPDGHPGTV